MTKALRVKGIWAVIAVICLLAGQVLGSGWAPAVAAEVQQGVESQQAFLSGGGVFIAGLAASPTAASVLRFLNTGPAAGTVSVTLYDAASGTEQGTWTSASIPVGGSLQVNVSDVFASATPSLTAAEQASTLNGLVQSTFFGTFQSLVYDGVSFTDATTCGDAGNVLGYVEGPAFPGSTGIIEVANIGSAAGAVTLSLVDTGTGAQIATWTSPSVPPEASLDVSTSTIAAGATPVVPATTTAFNVFRIRGATFYRGAQMYIRHFVKGSSAANASNITPTCPLVSDRF